MSATTTQVKPTPPAAERRPRNFLGGALELETDADLALAMREMQWIKSRMDGIAASCRIDVDNVKSAAEKRMRVTIDREATTMAERLQALEAAVRTYCDAHRKELLEGLGKKKTRSLTYGDIAWKSPPAQLTDDGLIGAVDELADFEDGVRGRLLAALSEIECTPTLSAADFLNLDIKVDRAAILSMHKKGQVTDDELAALKLTVEKPGETFAVKPYPYTVKAEAA